MSLRLQQRVLVLNRAWQPVNIVGVRRAVSMLFQGIANAVFEMPGQGDSGDPSGSYAVLDIEGWFAFSKEHPDFDSSRMLRSVRLALRLPHVVLLTQFERLPRRDVRFCRRNVYLRDGFRCQYCGGVFDERELTLDHVIPRDRGGRTAWENIVTACARCNARKSDRLPAQAGMVLRQPPARPKWHAFLSVLATREEARPWLPFIGNSRSSWLNLAHLTAQP
ncbi:MAG: HNH endonuclease [Puniceicoccales bacterium]|jgi:5-methylcytosine-specific restriction endonuclease McrA|nr:HNH endonuclease [Puniceicoccales bacterium]